MGTSFFKGAGKPGAIGGGPQSMEARAGGAPAYAAVRAASGAQKSLGAALAANKGGAHKPLTGSAAYPKGPKL